MGHYSNLQEPLCGVMKVQQTLQYKIAIKKEPGGGPGAGERDGKRGQCVRIFM
jgi:hypothetical protein